MKPCARRALPALALLLSSCAFFGVEEQLQKLDATCIIEGRVGAERKADAPLVVGLARQVGADASRRESWQMADHFVLDGPGLWRFYVNPGTYGLLAFQDLSRDSKYQPDEPYLRLEPARTVVCKAGEDYRDLQLVIPAAGRSRFNETVDFASVQVRSLDQQIAVSLGQVTAVGEVASLADSRFEPAMADEGLWRPFDFLYKGHPGIYFLQAYQREKIPLLFVHGLNGTPRDFQALSEGIDRQRFQPWIYYYPSGGSLDRIADHLAQTMRKLQLQYGFPQFVVVAHSMGGLVSRGFLLRYTGDGGRAAVPLFVSISTPWDGHKAAEMAKKTPVTPPRVFLDMAPGSEYLKTIYATELRVPHYLFFSYRHTGVSVGETDDGAVTVASQLRLEAQRKAVRVEGYNETHMSVLESAAVLGRLNGLLAQVPAR